MNTSLDVFAYSVAGLKGCTLPAARTVAFPPPGMHARQARLPGVGVALAKQALPSPGGAAEISVFFGTALGCLTETQAFLRNMIVQHEATPMPRAFSLSVYNAIASQVTIALKAHGESQTLVHADVAFLQALFTAVRHWEREPRGLLIVGGVDESTPCTCQARAACGWRKEEENAEGGAVLVCGEGAQAMPALARVRRVGLAPRRNALAWIAATLATDRVDALLMAYPSGSPAPGVPIPANTRTIDCRAFTGDHPSSCAAAAAMAVGLLCGELDPASLSLEGTPRAIAIAAASQYGDAALAVLEHAS